MQPWVTVEKCLSDLFCFCLFLLVFQSVVRCLWHPKLNQIMVGTGNGLVKVYYDPVKSHRYVRFRPFTDKSLTFALSEVCCEILR